MTFRFMRWLDQNIGRLLTLVFAVVRVLLRPFCSPPTMPPNVIAVQKFLGMGSVVLSFPLLEALRASFPKARIIYCTFASNREILRHSDCLDEVITVRPTSLFTFFFDTIRAVFALRRLGVDTVLDLEFFSRYTLLFSFCTGASRRFGFASYNDNRESLLTQSVPLNHYRHISRCFLAMAEPLGVPVPADPLVIDFPRAESVTKPPQLEAFSEQDILIAINPNASELCTMRRWPRESFLALIDALTEEPSVHVFLIGSPKEKNYNHWLLEHAQRVHQIHNLAGSTSVQELLGVLKFCRLLVTNDSGPSHLAALFQTPSVVLFGPETPVLYHPLNPSLEILYKHKYCSPCINALDNKSFEQCDEPLCMHDIELSDVLKAIKALVPSLLDAPPPSPNPSPLPQVLHSALALGLLRLPQEMSSLHGVPGEPPDGSDLLASVHDKVLDLVDPSQEDAAARHEMEQFDQIPTLGTCYFRRTLFHCIEIMLKERLRIDGSEQFVFAELGGGEGYLARTLRSHWPHSLGVVCDLSLQHLKRAPASLLRIRADIRKPLFTDGSLDLAAFWVSLHHLEESDQQEALRATYRALKPGGAVLLFEPNGSFWPRRLLMRTVLSRLVYFDEKESAIRYDQMRQRLQEAGFVEDMTFAHSPPYNYDFLMRLKLPRFLYLCTEILHRMDPGSFCRDPLAMARRSAEAESPSLSTGSYLVSLWRKPLPERGCPDHI